jgi:putative DNA methylase
MHRLIEKDFPFARLSLIAEQESWRKEVYRPIYYLHKWWARRLGSVFRGIVLGACTNDSDNFWNLFYSKNNFDGTTLFDPFMGSGVTVGEAIKLGCRAIGRDINPVAYIACRAAFSRYLPPDVLHTYQCLEKQLASKLLEYFVTKNASGEEATVLYYFLVKVVGCPQCGQDIDLFKTRIFSRNAVPQKDASARAICPNCGAIVSTLYDAKGALCPHCSLSFNPQEGNISGPQVRCDTCRATFRLVDRMKSIEGPLGFRRYAKMVLTGDGQKQYETFNEFDRQLERKIAEEFAKITNKFSEVVIEPGYNTNQLLKHNYKYWHQLFSDRQLVCIGHMVEAIKEIQPPDLKVLFACLFSGVLEFNNLFTSFKGEGTGAVRHMFAHHVLKPEMMPLEANIWGTSKSSGSFSTLFHSRVERAIAYKYNPTEIRLNSSKAITVGGINQTLEKEIVENFSMFKTYPNSIYLSCGDSSCIDIPDKSIDLIVTDPPFFDNVHYSQLADFFYYWLNQILDLSRNTTTRSPNEVQDTDPEFFTTKLTSVFAECSRVLSEKGLFVFTYHHSRHEGWAAVHRAIRHSGFICTQAYPIKAEMSVSMPLQQAKSPIHLDLILVCRRDSQIVKDSWDSEVLSAINIAEKQIISLKSFGIKVSLGDAKVVLMGRFLCEAHRMKNLELEERFLGEIEKDIDRYVSRVISAKGEVLYTETKAEQLRLFEEMEKYLATKLKQPSDYLSA